MCQGCISACRIAWILYRVPQVRQAVNQQAIFPVFQLCLVNGGQHCHYLQKASELSSPFKLVFMPSE